MSAFKPITVTQLNTYLKQVFDAEEMLHGISVFGEISGFSITRGTAYFTLKDASSTLSCVCFSADRFSEFKNGDSVMLIGSVTYYTKSGKLNFNVIRIEHYGENILYQQFIELKNRLEALGYFGYDIKKPMPQNIKRIGVVSSKEGAVIQDIINIRTRRNASIDIVLYPVKVQGTGAEKEIAHGIEMLDKYEVDVIVVARGGGSFEDLAPFNTEIVANAVFNCAKPLVSAVGHETDYTIIDFCSDLRAPTPSAAAEILCCDLEERKRGYVNNVSRLYKLANNFISIKKEFWIEKYNAVSKHISYMLENCKLVFESQINKYIGQSKLFLDRNFTKVEKNTEILNKLNPTQILKLGYACVRHNDTTIKSVHNITIGDNLDIVLKDGTINAIVKQVKEIKWVTKN